MQYHIGTMFIWDNFTDKSECPVCELKKKTESGLVDSYLGEAVMEDSTRNEVNKKGFCVKHYDMLYMGESKLGLALQMQTRMNKLFKLFDEVSLKQAKKHSAKIEEAISSCVVCDYLELDMVRYYKTIAQMYLAEEKFRNALNTTKGFCYHHYAKLVEYSNYAGKRANDYLKDLSRIQQENFTRIKEELQTFIDSFDYRNIGKPIGSAKDVLVRIRTKAYEKK